MTNITPLDLDGRYREAEHRLRLRGLDRDGDPYDGIGAQLADARARRGLSTEQIAARLRIRRAHLTAIEQGRFDLLPGRAYAVGFIRSYATNVGLDRDAAVQAFKMETAPAREPLVFPVAEPSERMPKRWMIGASVALAAVVFGVWAYFEGSRLLAPGPVPPPDEPLTAADPADALPAVEVAARPAPEAVAAAPEAEGGALPAIGRALGFPGVPPAADPAAPVPPVAEPPEAPPAVALPAAEAPAVEPAAPVEPAPAVELADAAPPVAAPAAELPVPEVVAVAPPPAAEAPAAEPVEPAPTPAPAAALPAIPPPVPADAAAPDEPEPQVYGAVDGEVRIVIRAHQLSWVQVTGAGGELLLSRILRAGDVFRAPDREGLVLTTGNAGALEVVVDGTVVPSLGPVGSVRRNVSLDPARLLAGNAVQR